MRIVPPTTPTWLDSYMACRDNRQLFATGVLGVYAPGTAPPEDPDAFELEPWQWDGLGDLDAGCLRWSCVAGHGCGKTTFLAIVALHWIMTRRDAKVAFVATSQAQMRDTNHAEIVKMHKRLPEDLAEQVEIGIERIAMKAAPAESFISFRTCPPGRSDVLQGFHATHQLAIFDEACEIERPVYEVASGAMSTAGAVWITTGNPTATGTFFHDIHTKLRDDWKCVRVSSRDVPRAHGHIESLEKQYGPTSNVVRVRVDGLFPVESDATVIPLRWIEAAVNRKVDSLRVHAVAAIDCARFGDDRSVLTLRQGNALLEQQTYQKRDLMWLCNKIKHWYHELPTDLQPCEIVVDAIGLGAGVADRLSEMNFTRINALNVGESASARDTMFNMRAELYWRAREWFEAHDCKLPEGYEELAAELSSVEYKFSPSGKLQIVSKEQMKKDFGKSPDLADSFVYTLAADDRKRLEKDIHRYGSVYEAEPINPWIA